LTPAADGIKARAMTDEAQDNVAALSFEAALKRLEEIVRKLESGEASLDEAIALYGEGDRLKQQCEARLAAAQARIEQIQFGPGGAPSGTAPFGAD
jgi:exodeoxyribonuclease VII small subunit